MLKLVPAKLDDLEYIVDVYNQIIPSRLATADLEPVTVADRLDWFHAHNEQYPLWILWDGQQKVGWMSLSRYITRAAYDQTVEISIYLDQKVRGKGFGTQAVQLAEAEAKRLNIRVIVSLIFKHNGASIHLFEKMNYELWGHLPATGVMDGKLVDLEIYGKHLDSPIEE